MKKIIKWTAGALVFLAVNGSTAKAAEWRKRTPERFEKENQAIQRDIAHILVYRQNIDFMKARLRHDRKTRNTSGVETDKRELTKLKGDLDKEKKYLSADKRDLQKSYRTAIKERKQVIRRNKKELCRTKKLERQEKTADYRTPNDELIGIYERDIASDREAIKELRSDRSENLLAVNKDIRKAKGENLLVSYAEAGVAGISNWMKK